MEQINCVRNTKLNRNRVIRLASVIGLMSVFGGMVALTPARADDDWRFRREGVHVYRDIEDIHHDEAMLRDLYHRRDEEKRRHDWDDVRALDRKIDSLRWHIDHDRRDLHKDIEKSRYDRDRDRDRYRDHDDYRVHDGR